MWMGRRTRKQLQASQDFICSTVTPFPFKRAFAFRRATNLSLCVRLTASVRSYFLEVARANQSLHGMAHPEDIPIIMNMAKSAPITLGPLLNAGGNSSSSSASSTFPSLNPWTGFLQEAAAAANSQPTAPSVFASLNYSRLPPYLGKIPSVHAPHLKADALNTIASGQFTELSALLPLLHSETLSAASANPAVTVVDGALRLSKVVNRTPVTGLSMWNVAWSNLKGCVQEHLQGLQFVAQTNPASLSGYSPLSLQSVRHMETYEAHLVCTHTVASLLRPLSHSLVVQRTLSCRFPEKLVIQYDIIHRHSKLLWSHEGWEKGDDALLLSLVSTMAIHQPAPRTK